MTSSLEALRVRRRAILALVLACSFWALGFPLTKALAARAELLAAGISTWFVAALLVTARFFGAALLLVALQRGRPNRNEFVQGLWLGLTSGVGLLFQTDALAYTEASTSAFLTQGYVFFLPIIAALSTRRLPALPVVSGVVLVVAGLAILSRFDPRTLALGRGEGETLLAATCFTFQILALDARRFAGNRTPQVTNVMFVTIALVALPVTIGTARDMADFGAVLGTWPSFVFFALLVAFCTIGAFLLMNNFQRGVSASEAGVIYGMEPVFTSVFALVLPGWLSLLGGIDYENEVIGGRLLFGGSLVIAANLLVSLFQRPAAVSIELSPSAE